MASAAPHRGNEEKMRVNVKVPGEEEVEGKGEGEGFALI